MSINALNLKYRTAMVAYFTNSRSLTEPYNSYPCTCYDEDIMTGDICVVKTKSSGYVLGLVESFESDDTTVYAREIICKADFTAFNEREQRRITATKLREQMKERAAAVQETLIFETLAERDPSMKALLDQYFGVTGIAPSNHTTQEDAS